MKTLKGPWAASPPPQASLQLLAPLVQSSTNRHSVFGCRLRDCWKYTISEYSGFSHRILHISNTSVDPYKFSNGFPRRSSVHLFCVCGESSDPDTPATLVAIIPRMYASFWLWGSTEICSSKYCASLSYPVGAMSKTLTSPWLIRSQNHLGVNTPAQVSL